MNLGKWDPANIEAMLKREEEEDKKLLKELGFDEAEDPELAALEKEMMKNDPTKLAKQGPDFSKIDVDNMELEEEDFNDPELMADLKELGGSDEEEDPGTVEAQRAKLEEIRKNIKEYHEHALKAKKEGQTKLAVSYLKKKKENESAEAEMLAAFPELKQPAPKRVVQQEHVVGAAKSDAPAAAGGGGSIAIPDDEVEVEEMFHNPDDMNSISVLEEEIGVAEKKKKRGGKDATFYEDKAEILGWRKGDLENNVGDGIITPEKYVADVKKSLQKQKGLLARVSGSAKTSKFGAETVARISKRIELMESEIKEFEEGPPPDEEEEEENAMQVEEEEEEKKAHPASVPRQSHHQPRAPPQQPVLKQQESVDVVAKEEIAYEDIDWRGVDKKAYDIVAARKEQYREVATFYNEQGNKQKTLEFLTIAERLQKCKDLLLKGKKVDMLKVDPEVTPQVVLGIDEATRNKKFTLLIAELNKEFELHFKKAKFSQEMAKKDKKNSKRHVAEAHAQADKVKTVKAQKQQLEELMKNRWQPVPLYRIDEIPEEFEKVNKEIDAQVLQVRVQVPPAAIGTKGLYLKPKLLISDGNLFEGTLELNKAEAVIEIPIPDKTHWRNLEKKELRLKVKKSRFMISDKTLEENGFKLTECAKKCEFEQEIQIDGHKATAIIRTRQPTKEKHMETRTKKKLVIDSFPPAFRAEGVTVLAAAQIPSSRAPQAQQPQPAQQQQRPSAAAGGAHGPPLQRTKTQAQKRRATMKDPPMPNGMSLPAGITSDEVNDPECARNLTNFSYLEKLNEELTAQVNKLSKEGEKVPQFIVDKLSLVTRNKASIEAQTESGVLTPERYMEFQRKQLAHDQQLVEFFMKYKQTGKAGIVRERMRIIQQELDES